MVYKAWTKIDNGREGLWDLDVWLGVIELVAKHEGESVYDQNSAIYKDLESEFPGRGWLKFDQAAGGKQFRPLFRDYAKPWTITDTIDLESQTFKLAPLGRDLVTKSIGPSDVFFRLVKSWQEAEEFPFHILSAAFLEYGQPLTIDDIYHGVMLGYRPGDDVNKSILTARKTTSAESDTEARRLKLMLRIMEQAGMIAKSGNKWFGWNLDLLQEVAGLRKTIAIRKDAAVEIPKPFLLLAGISGTGKSRFVKLQADGDDGCYELVPVRPDWHEPSDLLGYVSRINTDRYVVTPFLKFLVRAWKDAFSALESGVLTLNLNMKTFWLCLDEMNLAPVEQYFADYLSVLETRTWKKGRYSSEPLLKPAALEDDVRRTLREGLDLVEDDPLWSFFMEKGIQLAPNLVVAGTVNMDETTHGFSRKVIDRAYTIDFGDFFPNHFDQFFTQQTRPKKLAYSRLSSVDRSEPMSVADPEGTRSIQFLTEVNEIFKDTPYQLAFRAVNELLVTLKCFAPSDDLQLKAVWDDFLMAKLLPRVEGDLQKIGQGDASLLKKLAKLLELKGFEGNRPDLLSESVSGGAVETGFRSPKKLSWMQKRLDDNGFTSFWP